MENLPESLYVDPTYASSSNIFPPYTGSAGAGPSGAAGPSQRRQQQQLPRRMTIEEMLQLLHQPHRREEALTLLNKVQKERGLSGELPLLLWYSTGTVFILLQELLLAYRLLSPPRLTMKESMKTCNALALLQCMATIPELKMKLIEARIPMYVYPFLNTTEREARPLEYLRVTGLGVVAALLKVEDSNTRDIVHFLLDTEVVPLCIRCMDVGCDLSKTLAALILSKILMQELGQLYCGTFAERFYAVANALSKVVSEFSGKPPPRLLKQVLLCYLRLSEVSRVCDALINCYPRRLRDPVYLNAVCSDDVSLRRLADQVLNSIMTGPRVITDGMEELLEAFARF